MQSHKGQRMIYKTLHRTDNAITQRDKEWSTKHYTEDRTTGIFLRIYDIPVVIILQGCHAWSKKMLTIS